MKALILNGGSGNGRGEACRKIKDAATQEFRSRGLEVTAYDLDGMNIKPCRGCFACWVKHPGTCAIQDDGENVVRSIVASDVVLWITPVTFGGYSSALKKALDRSIPILLPFFIQVHGEIHHPQRYEKRRKILAAGTLANPDGEAALIFHGLVRRNAINMASLRTETCVVPENADDAAAAEAVRGLLLAAEIS